MVFELCIKFSFQIYNSLGWVFQLNISETSTSTNHGSCSLICQVWLSFPIMFYSGPVCAGAQYWTVNIKPPSTSLVFPLCLELWRLPRSLIFLKVHKLCLQFWWKHKLAPIFQWRTLNSVTPSPGSNSVIFSLIISNGSCGPHGNLQSHQDQHSKHSLRMLLLVPRVGLGVWISF